MLESVKISRRQSEIRQQLAGLAAKAEPSEDETRSMETLDAEYRVNETRYRASLIAEDTERRDAGAELETREGRERADLLRRFEVRQAVLALDEGRQLDGATAEIVTELRAAGGFRGVPIPLEALERRAGETVASGVPDPKTTHPIIDRLFAPTAAARMGAQMISIPAGEHEWPIVTSAVTAAWAATETGNVGGPTAFATTDRTLAPDHTFGVQLKVTRKALKQSGAALEDAIRRDLNGAITTGLDQAVFLGTGADGEPLGVIAGAATYGITSTAIDAAASWAGFRAAITRFLTAHAATGPSAARVLIRPEVWDALDGTYVDTGSGVTEWDRMVANVGRESVVMSANALAAPAGGPPVESSALLTTTAGGVSPIFVGLWGAVDLIRDPYSDAQSGGLRLTGLLTADLTVSRSEQLELLTGIQ